MVNCLERVAESTWTLFKRHSLSVSLRQTKIDDEVGESCKLEIEPVGIGNSRHGI